MMGKKPRKPYTVTRPRERWTAGEHGRFLRGLVMFGRDWKRVEALVATKTATQIRSHAQKHFLRAQKAGLAVPPPQQPPRRGDAVLRLRRPPVICSSAWFAGEASAADEEMMLQLPLSPDDPQFAVVYRFVGDVFGSGVPVEAQLQRLLGADPAIVDTILRVLGNLEANQAL